MHGRKEWPLAGVVGEELGVLFFFSMNTLDCPNHWWG